MFNFKIEVKEEKACKLKLADLKIERNILKKQNYVPITWKGNFYAGISNKQKLYIYNYHARWNYLDLFKVKAYHSLPQVIKTQKKKNENKQPPSAPDWTNKISL